MTDIHEPLAAEAPHQRPTRQPTMADPPDRQRSRRRRYYAAGALAATIAIAIGAGIATLGGHRDGPPGPGPTATVHASLITVTGMLLIVGGPSLAGPKPVAGEVVFTASDGGQWTAPSAADGRFSIAVPPGQYAVTGHSPSYGDGRGVCRAAGPVAVSGSAVPTVLVMCHIR